MAPRAKLGSYIIDADGDSSTTSGVTLYPDSATGLDSEPLPMIWDISTTQAQCGFNVQISAASESALTTARDALIAAVVNVAGDVILESTDDTTLAAFKTSTGEYAEHQGQCRVIDGETACIVEVVITSTKTQSGHGTGTAGGIENPLGLVGSVLASAERQIAGRLGIVLEANFKDSVSGDSDHTKTAQERATVWFKAVNDRTVVPAWLPATAAAMRVVDEVVDFNSAATDDSTAGTARARISLRETPSALTTLNAKIRDVTYIVNFTPRSIDQNAGGAVPIDIVIAGTFQTKTEGNSDFDSSDSAPAVLTSTERNTAIDVIVADAVSRVGIGIKELSRDVSVAGESGEITFAVRAFASSTTIVEWDEVIDIEAVDSAAIVNDSKGKDWIYEEPSAPPTTVSHTLRVVKFGGPYAYRPPSIVNKSDWRAVHNRRSAPIVKRFHRGGNVSYENRHYAQYRLIRKGDRQSFAGDVLEVVGRTGEGVT